MKGGEVEGQGKRAVVTRSTGRVGCFSLPLGRYGCAELEDDVWVSCAFVPGVISRASAGWKKEIRRG